MKTIRDLHVTLFCDGADPDAMLEMYARPWVRGFTTNPTLMRKAGIRDYELFARKLLRMIPDLPISFEVCSDEEKDIERQALAICRWGNNVNVKIPVTNRDGVFHGALIERLARSGVMVNVTAVMTLDQVARVAEVIPPAAPAIVSVFAGRIADTGIDPVPLMQKAKWLLRCRPRVKLLWASPRELLNIFQADAAGADIITAPPEILRKLSLIGKDLTEYSRETVDMFYRDALAAGYRVDSDCRAGGAPAGLTPPPCALFSAAHRQGAEERPGCREESVVRG